MSATLHRRIAWRDIESFGAATISGTVKELTTPVANRQVLLLEQDGLRCRRETRSAADGSYSFANVREGTEWVVLAFDPNGAYNAVVADRVQT